MGMDSEIAMIAYLSFVQEEQLKIILSKLVKVCDLVDLLKGGRKKRQLFCSFHSKAYMRAQRPIQWQQVQYRISSHYLANPM